MISEYAIAISSTHVKRFRHLAKSWPHRELILNSQRGLVSIRWCPFHSGKSGNETTDTLAKAACNDLLPNLPMTIARTGRKIKKNYESLIVDNWNKSVPARCKNLQVSPNSKITTELGSLS